MRGTSVLTGGASWLPGEGRRIRRAIQLPGETTCVSDPLRPKAEWRAVSFGDGGGNIGFLRIANQRERMVTPGPGRIMSLPGASAERVRDSVAERASR